MFLKELSAAIFPWWTIACILLMPFSWSHSLLLIVGSYLFLTEFAYRHAKFKSARDGFHRIVRMPVNPWLLRLLSCGRFHVPRGVPCFTMHVMSQKTDTPRSFFRELEADIRHGISSDAFYVGTTFADLASRVNSVLACQRACVLNGVLVPGQTWNVNPERQQIRLFSRVFTRHEELAWKIVLIRAGLDPTDRKE